MAEVRFFGHSDDLIEIYGDVMNGRPDEISLPAGDWSTFKLPELNIRVHAEYSTRHNNGTWMLGVSIIDEDLPKIWQDMGGKIEFINDVEYAPNNASSYSPTLLISVPNMEDILIIFDQEDED